MKPLFSIVVIMKNEGKTLPRLAESLKEFIARGGDWVCLDTGSTDNSIEVAKSLGADVFRNDGFIFTIDKITAQKINNKFIVKEEAAAVHAGDTFFNYSKARNHAVEFTKHDIVFYFDADEVAERMDIDKINQHIIDGATQFDYNFVFAKDEWGNEQVKFIQSKAYNKNILHWQGIIHELLVPIGNEQPKKVFLDEPVYKLSHYQNHDTGRHTYLKGLLYDCYNNPNNDRHSHYAGRELFWSGRYKSAIKELKRHVTMGGWNSERAQSCIFIGDAYGHLNQPEQQVEYYNKAFYIDNTRREPLIKLAEFYQHNNAPQSTACYAAAALEIAWNPFYANQLSHYREVPHALAYWAEGWIGNIPAAQKHILEALKYQPTNWKFLEDTKYYFEYAAPPIEGWMTYPELTWLYETAKKYETIVEVGSWKGRSTHALCSGCKGTVTAVDTWMGSADVLDMTHDLAKKEDVFEVFKNNTKQFTNLKVIKKTSVEAAKDFEDNSIEFVFLDAGHTKEELLADIKAWLPKCKKMICGHDYLPGTWMGVIEAVDEIFGKPEGLCESIWYQNIKQEVVPFIWDKEESTQIPKTIYTAWLSEEPMPEGIKKCIESQKIPGYEHYLIELDTCPKVIPYVNDAIKAKKWVKAVDFLKMYYLENNGGIFMDADMEILPGKNFDAMLSNKMFAAKEENGFVGYSLVGSIAHHPIAQKYLEEVPKQFKGDDDLNFESSMEVFTKLAFESNEIKLYEPEYFFPYNHQTGIINVTDKTIAFHHFYKSWINTTDLLPTVSILIPQLGREEGLQRCLTSIDRLYYPKHLIEVLIEEGEDTVPVKIDRMYKRSKGSVIVYASNDIEFTPTSLYNAVIATRNYGLVAFNTGEVYPDLGNVNEHFAITRTLVEQLGGQIFDLRFHHVSCDNLLWHKAYQLGQAVRHENAIVHHYHFSRGGQMDEVYEKGWSHVAEDRKLLAELI